jgi:DNA-binding transcriptional regulator YhcF (GntR family)
VIVREGPVAPWRQVFELYRQRIESGELPPGSRVPSVRGMSQEFGIAGTTAQKVIAALKADGLVVTSPMGTYVRQPD